MQRWFPAAAAALVAGAAFVNAAHNITIPNNATSVQYTGGTLTLYDSQGDWKPFNNCGGTQYTYTTGQFFTVDFVGTAVYLIGTASLSGGEVGIQLDGTATSFDRYAPLPYRCGVEWFSKDNLQNTSHTLTVTMQGDSPENATTQGYLEWQWVVYTQLDATDLAAASSSSIASLSSASAATQTISSSGAPSGTAVPAKKSNGGAIGGGIAAGVIVLGALGFLLFWYCRRQKSSSSNYPTSRPDLGGDTHVTYPAAYGSGYGQPGPAMAQTAGIAGATPWIPDASDAASLGPQTAHTHSPPQSPARPALNNFSSPSQQPLLFPSPSTNTDPYPPSLNPTSTQHAPSALGPSSRDGSGSGGGSGGLGDNDVDRIAARVASLMIQNQGPQPVGAAPEFDAPPPMYNEKH